VRSQPVTGPWGLMQEKQGQTAVALIGPQLVTWAVVRAPRIRVSEQQAAWPRPSRPLHRKPGNVGSGPLSPKPEMSRA